jgi:hypothetical protein
MGLSRNYDFALRGRKIQGILGKKLQGILGRR